ncbi:MAG: hypothetical protein IBX52_05010 [Bacterioplanes sp.]|nr:hypothetical protein [Bacterioplanes sp.]
MNDVDFINALDDLAEVLESFYGKGVRDISGLKRGVSSLRKRLAVPKQREYPLNIHIARMSFDIQGHHKHTLPAGATDSILTLSVKICFRDKFAVFSDIVEMSVDFELYSNDENGQPVKSAWHLDYHDVKGDEKFSHPRFHFQFGGKRLRESIREKNCHFNTGELLLMESPRLMHPPMDPVLAVDFVFGNFLGDECWKALRQKRSFINIHKASKELFWKPYFEGISGYFSNPNTPSHAIALHPGL